jgi:hypothetical protein
MFDFKKRDERVSNIENRVSAIENRTLMLENDFQYRLGQFHKLMSDMVDMRDHVVKLEDELTIAKNLLITRKHAEIKRQEDPVENDTPTSEEVAVRKRRKSKRYDAADAPDVALRKSLGREDYWRTKARELESKLAINLSPPSQQPEAQL